MVFVVLVSTISFVFVFVFTLCIVSSYFRHRFDRTKIYQFVSATLAPLLLFLLQWLRLVYGVDNKDQHAVHIKQMEWRLIMWPADQQIGFVSPRSIESMLGHSETKNVNSISTHVIMMSAVMCCDRIYSHVNYILVRASWRFNCAMCAPGRTWAHLGAPHHRSIHR